MVARCNQAGAAWTTHRERAQMLAVPYVVDDNEGVAVEEHRGPAAARAHDPRPGLEALVRRGIRWTTLTLHVGPGTFLPVKVTNPRDHPMHAEAFSVPAETALAAVRSKTFSSKRRTSPRRRVTRRGP